MFDSEKKSEGLDSSTFDIVKIDAFHNTRLWTLLSFAWVWIVIILKIAILGGDTYTCVSILVFHRWSSSEYKVYEYKVAQWIFTGCIFFRFVLLAYQIAWGVHIYRTRNIALAYLNNYACLMYAIRSYDYQCLFHEIDQDGFFEWACFLVYTELDNALEVLVADLPRQVINFMTLRYYATGGELNNDILANIKTIATTNIRLSITLSFQLGTMVLFLFFYFKFLLAIILYIPIKVTVAGKGFCSLKAFCYRSVNEKVRYLVKRNHKSRTQILNEGALNFKEIQANPLLGSSSTFDMGSWQRPSGVRVYGQDSMNESPGPVSFHNQSTSAISLDHFPRQKVLGDVRKPTNEKLFRAYENPFADFDPNISPGFEHSTEANNPFLDGTEVSEIYPPLRSQTSDSWMSRRSEGNFLIPGRNDINGSNISLSTIAIKPSAGLGNLSANAFENLHSTRLLRKKSGTDYSTGEHPSFDVSLGYNSHLDLYLEEAPEFDTNERTILEPPFDQVTHIPYPVRSISQYFTDKNGN